MTSSIRLTKRFGIPSPGPEAAPPRSLRLLSVRGAADYAQVSTQTMRRVVKAGDLKSYRLGRQIRIDESDLIIYMSGKKQK